MFRCFLALLLCLTIHSGKARNWAVPDKAENQDPRQSDQDFLDPEFTSSGEIYYDYDIEDNPNGDDSTIASSSEEEFTYDLNQWRRVIKLNKEKFGEPTTTGFVKPVEAKKLEGRRFFMVTPSPPVPPDVGMIEDIRKRLKGKTLQDTGFGNNNSYKMAVAFTSDFGGVQNQAARDLQQVICLMDCQVASNTHNAGFRGKNWQKVEEELEMQWNNMTEVERQLITNIATSKETRRSVTSTFPTGFTTVFQIFSDWCSDNCKAKATKRPVHRKRKNFKGKGKAFVTSEEEIENTGEDYDSDESGEEGQKSGDRRAEDLSLKEITEKSTEFLSLPTNVTVEVPVAQITYKIFGETIMASLSNARLCVCGVKVNKICYCQSE